MALLSVSPITYKTRQVKGGNQRGTRREGPVEHDRVPIGSEPNSSSRLVLSDHSKEVDPLPCRIKGGFLARLKASLSNHEEWIRMEILVTY